MNAKHAALVIPALTIAFTLAACIDDEITRPNEARTPTVAAHDPSLHGVRASVVAAVLPDYTSLNGGSGEGGGGGLKLEADATGAIPRFADSYVSGVAVFGYAWADLATGRGVVAVIHPVIGRDSNQNPDAWHTHPVQLAGGTGASNFCIVSIGTSQAGIAIVGNRVRVNISANQAGVSAADLDVVASFIVQPNAGCAGTGLGVAVLSAVSL